MECRSPPVLITALLARPALSEEEGGVRGSYAQVVKSAEAVRAEEARVREQVAKKKGEEEKLVLDEVARIYR